MRLAIGPIYTRKAFPHPPPPPPSHPPTPGPSSPHHYPQHTIVLNVLLLNPSVLQGELTVGSYLLNNALILSWLVLIVVVLTCWLHICVLFFHLLLQTKQSPSHWHLWHFIHLYTSLSPVIVLSVYLLLLGLVINAVHRPPHVWKQKQKKRQLDLFTAVQRFFYPPISQVSYQAIFTCLSLVLSCYITNIMGWKLWVDNTKIRCVHGSSTREELSHCSIPVNVCCLS